MKLSIHYRVPIRFHYVKQDYIKHMKVSKFVSHNGQFVNEKILYVHNTHESKVMEAEIIDLENFKCIHSKISRPFISRVIFCKLFNTTRV
jgi:hypothetical protein